MKQQLADAKRHVKILQRELERMRREKEEVEESLNEQTRVCDELRHELERQKVSYQRAS